MAWSLHEISEASASPAGRHPVNRSRRKPTSDNPLRPGARVVAGVGTAHAERVVMAHLALSLLAPRGQAAEIAEALRSLSRRAQLDRGCDSSEVYASLEDESRLSLQQEWVAEADLARYVRSDDFSAVLALLDLAAAPPAIEFQCSGQKRGLDYVAELRGGQSPAGSSG
jgi:quinol monooxygenase YgiN